MKNPQPPQSQIEEVLYYLITRLKIDRRQMMLSVGVLNLPEQIRKLRVNYGIEIELSSMDVTNKYGRVVTVGEYYIKDKTKARTIYNSIQEARELREAYGR